MPSLGSPHSSHHHCKRLDPHHQHHSVTSRAFVTSIIIAIVVFTRCLHHRRHHHCHSHSRVCFHRTSLPSSPSPPPFTNSHHDSHHQRHLVVCLAESSQQHRNATVSVPVAAPLSWLWSLSFWNVFAFLVLVLLFAVGDVVFSDDVLIMRQERDFRVFYGRG